MPNLVHELHVVEAFEGHAAGEVITDDATIRSLWLGPMTDRLRLIKRAIQPAPAPQQAPE